jgi:hypothetical protein
MFQPRSRFGNSFQQGSSACASQSLGIGLGSWFPRCSQGRRQGVITGGSAADELPGLQRVGYDVLRRERFVFWLVAGSVIARDDCPWLVLFPRSGDVRDCCDTCDAPERVRESTGLNHSWFWLQLSRDPALVRCWKVRLWCQVLLGPIQHVLRAPHSFAALFRLLSRRVTGFIEGEGSWRCTRLVRVRCGASRRRDKSQSRAWAGASPHSRHRLSAGCGRQGLRRFSLREVRRKLVGRRSVILGLYSVGRPGVARCQWGAVVVV